jgi:hypothetical protein
MLAPNAQTTPPDAQTPQMLAPDADHERLG